MKKHITLAAQTVLAAGAIFGLVSVAGAQIGSTSGTDATTDTSYYDPCGATTGAGWTAPTSTPPAGNVAAPVNVSSTTQLKSGKLVLGPIPCPVPASWAPTASKLTVNGVTDTFGFANWGTSFLSGKTAVGGRAPATMFGSPFTAPALYAKSGSGYSAFVADGGATVYGGLNVITGGISLPNGDIRLTGSGHIYENGARVCLESGAGCPASTGGTVGPMGPAGPTGPTGPMGPAGPAGMSSVSHDSSLSGSGTSSSPLGVVIGNSLYKCVGGTTPNAIVTASAACTGGGGTATYLGKLLP